MPAILIPLVGALKALFTWLFTTSVGWAIMSFLTVLGALFTDIGRAIVMWFMSLIIDNTLTLINGINISGVQAYNMQTLVDLIPIPVQQAMSMMNIPQIIALLVSALTTRLLVKTIPFTRL